MKTINLNEEEIVVLKSLLIQEIDYLNDEAIPSSSGEEKKELKEELKACNNILEQLK